MGHVLLIIQVVRKIQLKHEKRTIKLASTIFLIKPHFHRKTLRYNFEIMAMACTCRYLTSKCEKIGKRKVSLVGNSKRYTMGGGATREFSCNS